MLNKLLIIFLGLTSFVYAQQCPYPSTNYVNGYVTRYCYVRNAYSLKLIIQIYTGTK